MQSTADTPVIEYVEEIAMTLPQRQCLITQLQKVRQLRLLKFMSLFGQ